jgi:pantoate--beta-alanine ligase
MNIHTTVDGLRSELRPARAKGRRIGLVPTMGALHEGHLSLMRAARAASDFVVATIFVNPTQFGPNEDLAKYPRTFERDCDQLKKENVDFVFAPGVDEMYPQGSVTWVTVEGLSDKLDGKSRPGHFRGVTTVVAKLFHIVEPDIAFFGQKDAAQLAIIRQMVRDLKFPIEVVGCPILREPDGLAMSSRNVYLDPAQRKSALVLSRALRCMEQLFKQGERNSQVLAWAGKNEFSAEPTVRLDYLELVDPQSLDSVSEVKEGTLMAVAAYVGTTRLIDNLLLKVR